MAYTVIFLIFILCSMAYASQSVCILGNWKYYQTDGRWLFDVSVAAVGDTFEVRLLNWNTDIYRNAPFEKNRLISRLHYNA